MANLAELLKQRILVLDGAMGSMIQTYKLSEGRTLQGLAKRRQGQ